MMKRRFIPFTRKLAFAFAMILALTGILSAPAQAKSKFMTAKSSLPANTNTQKLVITLNKRTGPKTFTIRAQYNPKTKKKTYLSMHGCAVSALTTVLGAYNTKYANYTRGDVYKKVEKKVFGKKAWKSNYRKSLAGKSPVSLYGISTILRKCGIKNTYVRRFTNASAVSRIENHLKNGNVAIIMVNNHTQYNGRFKKAYNTRWAKSKHTMVLLGMTDTGKVMIADSADRTWAGNNQRIKYASMKNLVKYMIPCKSSRKYYYYHSTSDSGGYILVK